MYTYIATFNARTLRTENKRKELFHCFDSQSITILVVIDHKIVHNESDDDIVSNQVIQVYLLHLLHGGMMSMQLLEVWEL